MQDGVGEAFAKLRRKVRLDTKAGMNDHQMMFTIDVPEEAGLKTREIKVVTLRFTNRN